MSQSSGSGDPSHLERVEALVDRILSPAAIVILIAMTALVAYAVVARYVFRTPLIYSYDLSTLLFAWVVFLGLFAAERDKAHIGLDLVLDMKDGPLRRMLAVLRQVILIALAAYMTWIGYRLIQRTGMQIPSMRISAKWLYASLPVGFGALTLIYVLRLPGIIAGRKS